MSQSNRIFAFLAIAFVVFVTMRGELGTYLGFFVSSANTTNTASATAPNAQAMSYLGTATGQNIAMAGTYQPTTGANMGNVAVGVDALGFLLG